MPVLDPPTGEETGVQGPVRSYDGIVLGWALVTLGKARARDQHNHLLRVQTARTAADAKAGIVDEHEIVLSQLQVRQLAQTLSQVADVADGGPGIVTRVRRWFR